MKTKVVQHVERESECSPKILAIPGKNHQIYILNFDLRPLNCRHLRLFKKKKNGRRNPKSGPVAS